MNTYSMTPARYEYTDRIGNEYPNMDNMEAHLQERFGSDIANQIHYFFSEDWLTVTFEFDQVEDQEFHANAGQKLIALREIVEFQSADYAEWRDDEYE